MSIQTEITRLQGLRNTMRAALVALGLAQSTADLEDCVTAVEGIKNNGAVSGSITDAAKPYNVPAGYHNGQGTVGIAREAGGGQYQEWCYHPGRGWHLFRGGI